LLITVTAVGFGLCPLLVCGIARAQNYTVTTIDFPGALGTTAGGINDVGQIVGEFADSNGKGHGFLDSSGIFTAVDVPGASATQANGINNAGQIVGQFVDSAGNAHGFLYSGGGFTTIDPPGAVSAGAAGINSAGQIVGGYANPSTGNHGFLYSGGSFTNIDAPKTLTSYAFNDGTVSADRINDTGQIVGEWTCNGIVDSCGFLDSGGTFSLVNYPGASVTHATGINNIGQIVGSDCTVSDCSVSNQIFLYSGGGYTTIPVPGASGFSLGVGINNVGSVAGTFVDSAGVPHGFLATPNARSGTIALSAAVLPAGRSVKVGATATAFATIIDAGPADATGCSIAPQTSIPANFLYQTTNPATNALTGSPNAPINIANGTNQSFLVALTPTAAFAPTNVPFNFACTNAASAVVLSGINTLQLSASATAVPDIVALAASSDPGYVDITGATGVGDFAVATVNLGAAAQITASANTGSATLPVSLTLCQTNPGNGACMASPAMSVTTTIAANATPTFGIFATGSGTIANSPGANRVFVTFTDSGGVLRGETSVAIRTQ
jgi:probable HAF family extracellular repeat protein